MGFPQVASWPWPGRSMGIRCISIGERGETAPFFHRPIARRVELTKMEERGQSASHTYGTEQDGQLPPIASTQTTSRGNGRAQLSCRPSPRHSQNTPPPICPLPLCASVLSLSSVILPSNSIIFFFSQSQSMSTSHTKLCVFKRLLISGTESGRGHDSFRHRQKEMHSPLRRQDLLQIGVKIIGPQLFFLNQKGKKCH